MRARVQPIMAGLLHLYLHELRQGQKGNYSLKLGPGQCYSSVWADAADLQVSILPRPWCSDNQGWCKWEPMRDRRLLSPVTYQHSSRVLPFDLNWSVEWFSIYLITADVASQYFLHNQEVLRASCPPMSQYLPGEGALTRDWVLRVCLLSTTLDPPPASEPRLLVFLARPDLFLPRREPVLSRSERASASLASPC